LIVDGDASRYIGMGWQFRGGHGGHSHLAPSLQRGAVVRLEPGWEPGDGLTVVRTEDPQRLRLPSGLIATELPLVELMAADGKPLAFSLDPEAGELVVAELPRLLHPDQTALRLEFCCPGRFRLMAEAPVDNLADMQLTTDSGVRIVILSSEDGRMLFGATQGQPILEDFQLATRAARIGTHGAFDQLICLPLVREMELLEHQVRTAKTVLRRFRGRALLCDEVGLGKTIEAGLVLSELYLRGLARSVIVLVPPSLIEQWQGELRRKFSLDFITHDDVRFRGLGTDAWSQFDRVIVSTHTAKREPHRSAILSRRWDLVIIDEAHHFRSRTTQLWRFASELEKQYMLLLTATPVQNNLDELFNLVTLLEPGLLRTSRQFQKRFVDRRDKLTPKNVDELHELLSEVMIRNRRSTVGLQFTRRWATTLSVPLSPEEAHLYRKVTALVKQHLRGTSGTSPGTKQAAPPTKRGAISRIGLLALQMALGSSSQAAAGTLAKLAENHRLDAATREQLVRLAETAQQQPPGAKVERLIKLLEGFPDKMVIFTQFRATQAMLAEQLAAQGHNLAVFHGGLSRLEKEAAVRDFFGRARLLLCTEAGSEGRNLQFAHAVCNFDLPWNPMKIEQRIGRLSRIGQSHDVLVYNLVAAGTVEDAVLHLLDAKLSMFELVIGEIDMILGNLDDEQEFQDVVADLWVEAFDGDDFARRMEELGNRLLAAKQAYFEQRAHDDRLFGSRFSPDT
jgi:SNF2 family DNA or RNA helicase